MATYRILQLPPQTRANPMVTAHLQLLGEKQVCSRMALKYLSYTGPAQHPAAATAAFPLGNADGLLSVQHPRQGWLSC